MIKEGAAGRPTTQDAKRAMITSEPRITSRVEGARTSEGVFGTMNGVERVYISRPTCIGDRSNWRHMGGQVGQRTTGGSHPLRACDTGYVHP